VVINKVDRPRRPRRKCERIYDLFIDLDADESQLDFPVLYAVAKAGQRLSIRPFPRRPAAVVETIVSTIPLPPRRRGYACSPLVTNLRLLRYFGRIAICRVFQGTRTPATM